VLGALADRAGETATADRLYQSAWRLAKTEPLAGAELFQRAARAGDYSSAIKYADVQMRRWPARFPEFEKALLDLFHTHAGFDAMVRKLGEAPTWRDDFMRALIASPNDSALVEKAFANLADGDHPPSVDEINLAVDRLLARGEAAAAHRLFVATLSADERKVAGQIFNFAFALPSSGKRFDWRMQSGRGVEIIAPGGAEGALLHFLDRPARDIAFAQTIALAPGVYGLTATLSARDFTAPDGMFVSLTCVVGGKELARIKAPEGDFDLRRIGVKFATPDEGCPLQSVAVQSGLTVEAWNRRYSGYLRVASIQVEGLSQ